MCFPDLGLCVVDNGQIAQAKEVELEQAEVCNGIHIELRDHSTVTVRQRHVFADRLVGNHDARCVNGNVTRHALQCHGGIDQLAVFICIIVKLFELGQLQRMLQGNAQLRRHGFCNGVHLGIRHAHGSAAISDGGTCGKRTKSDDLRHVFPAIPLCHVVNDLVAAVVAKIDINIGHADSLGVEESLKKQIVANGIHVGNAQRKRHK